MSNRRTLMAAAAIVLALVAGIGVYMYASGADKRAQDNASFVDAYVANADIAKGTTGDELLQAGLDRARRRSPRARCRRRRSPTSNDLNGKVAVGPIEREAVHHRAARSCRRRTASAARSPTRSRATDLVAVTVTVDADRGVANQIAPGDHVEHRGQDRRRRRHAGAYAYILDHVKVLAVGASTVARSRPPPAVASADGSARRRRPTRACSPSR